MTTAQETHKATEKPTEPAEKTTAKEKEALKEKESRNKEKVDLQVAELQNVVEQQKQQIQDLIATAQRLQAEFENYRKRVDKETLELKKTANRELITKLLPVLDSFELAIKNKDKVQDFIKGMELIYAQLHDVLGKEGLRPIQAVSKKFDPYRHEVLLQEVRDDVKEDDVITEEFQKGYMLNEHVLRHSKVKIAKKKEKEEKKEVVHDRPSGPS